MIPSEKIQGLTDSMLSALDERAPLPARKSDAIASLKADLNAVNARILAMEVAADARTQVDLEAEITRQTYEGLDAMPEAAKPAPQLGFRE